MSFCLPRDYATAFAWEVNNDQTKPPGPLPLLKNYEYNVNGAAAHKLYRYHTTYVDSLPQEVFEYNLTDPYEAMPYACRSWGKTVGAEANTQGRINSFVNLGTPTYQLSGEEFPGFGDKHSGQFNASIQQLKPFYNELLRNFGINRNP